MSQGLAEAVGGPGRVTSIVLGDDVVPRLGVSNVERLRNDVMSRLRASPYNKNRILAAGCCQACCFEACVPALPETLPPSGGGGGSGGSASEEDLLRLPLTQGVTTRATSSPPSPARALGGSGGGGGAEEQRIDAALSRFLSPSHMQLTLGVVATSTRPMWAPGRIIHLVRAGPRGVGDVVLVCCLCVALAGL